MFNFWRSAASNSLYMPSARTSASSSSPLCTFRSKQRAARLLATKLFGSSTRDLYRPKAGVSCSQSRGSNGNHDMFAAASFIGLHPVDVVSSLARRTRAGGHLVGSFTERQAT